MLELPPAPAALVLAGLAFASWSFLSDAAFLLMAVAGPPGGFGELGRAVVEPEEAGGVSTGDCGRGDDYMLLVSKANGGISLGEIWRCVDCEGYMDIERG